MMTLLLPTILAAAFHFFLSVNMALVTPFAQHLGVPFHSVSYIWVLGPILGFAAQMFIGATSDSFRSRFGRRRPFVLLGAVGTLLSALLMAFGVDLGSLLGDNARETNGSRPMGAVFFIMGLCLADFAIHTTMGPFRALISEISGEGNKEMAYSLKVFWGAVGQILGYCASAYGTWEKVLPFLRTMSCGPTCANVKGPLLVAAVLLILCTAVVMVTGKEISTHMETRDENLVSPLLLPEAADIENGIITDTILFDAVLPAGIRANASSTASAWSAIIQGVQALFTPTPGSTQGVSDILLVVVLSWMAWFPFVLFNTDWMGRDIFGGSPHGTELSRTQYHMGVHEGAVGLVLHAIVLGTISMAIKPLCRRFGHKAIWTTANITLFVCLTAMVIVTLEPSDIRLAAPLWMKKSTWRPKAAVALIAILGAPMSVTMTIPSCLMGEHCSQRMGSGLAMAFLNVAIITPQALWSMLAGPLRAIWRSGNVPAFIASACFAVMAAIAATL